MRLKKCSCQFHPWILWHIPGSGWILCKTLVDVVIIDLFPPLGTGSTSLYSSLAVGTFHCTYSYPLTVAGGTIKTAVKLCLSMETNLVLQRSKLDWWKKSREFGKYFIVVVIMLLSDESVVCNDARHWGTFLCFKYMDHTGVLKRP